MDMMVRLAMSGAKNTMLAQAVNVNNLANASTPGFRGDLLKFATEQNTDGHESVPINSTDFRSGELQATGRSMDVAIDGEGWMVAQAPDGGEVYTRRGDLSINGQGQLTNGAGLPIMGNGGPIALPPSAQVEIGGDGTISVVPIGQGPNALAIVDRIALVELDENSLAKGEDGLLRLTNGAEAIPNAEIELISGTLESSNVNPIEALVKMIDLAREFETQVKMMDTAERNDQSLATILRIK